MLKALWLGTLTAGLLAACAAMPPAPDQVVADRTAATAPRVNCLTTGTRIALKNGECANVAGRAFSQDDLQRTGAFDTAQALRMLDPAFSR